jgi:hypothetical protein
MLRDRRFWAAMVLCSIGAGTLARPQEGSSSRQDPQPPTVPAKVKAKAKKKPARKVLTPAEKEEAAYDQVAADMAEMWAQRSVDDYNQAAAGLRGRATEEDYDKIAALVDAQIKLDLKAMSQLWAVPAEKKKAWLKAANEANRDQIQALEDQIQALRREILARPLSPPLP